MCGTIGTGNDKTIGKVTPNNGGSGIGNQNNQTKVVYGGYYDLTMPTSFQDALNLLNLTVLETDTPVYILMLTKTPGNGILVKQLWDFGKGKGTYNPVGATTTPAELVLIEESYPTEEEIEPIINEGILHDLGEISVDFIDYINNDLAELDLSDDSVPNYVKFILNDQTYIYQYTGQPLEYGTSSGNTAVATDFDLIYFSGNENTGFVEGQNLQQTVNNGEIADKIKLVKRSDFINYSFDDYTNGSVVWGDKLIVYGNFISYDGQLCNRIAILNADGTLFSNGLGFNLEVKKAILVGDKLICVGAFTNASDDTYVTAFPTNRVCCINLITQKIDKNFNTGGTGFNNLVNDVLYVDESLFFFGAFTQYNGNIRNRVVKTNINGLITDVLFVTTGFASGSVNKAVYSSSTNSIIAVGNFVNYNANSVNRIVAFSVINGSETILFGGFSTAPTYVDIYLNKIYVGGQLSQYGGNPIPHCIIRLNIDGSVDNTFNPGTNFNAGSDLINSIAFLNDKILIGGLFSKNIKVLNYSGGLDFLDASITTGFDAEVKSLDVYNNQVVALGLFRNYNDNQTFYFSLLNENINYSTSFEFLKFSFDNNGNGIGEYFTNKTFEQLGENELIPKKLFRNNYEKIIFYDANKILGTHTGDLLERILFQVRVKGNEYFVSDSLSIYLQCFKNLGSGNVTWRTRIGTTGTLSDSIAATFTGTGANSRSMFPERKNSTFLSGNQLRVFPALSPAITDSTTGGAATILTVNPAVDFIISFTAQLSISTEIATLEGVLITKIQRP